MFGISNKLEYILIKESVLKFAISISSRPINCGVKHPRSAASLYWLDIENSASSSSILVRYEDKDRYTIAFDLITQKGMEHFWFSRLNIDPKIYDADPLHLAIQL